MALPLQEARIAADVGRLGAPMHYGARGAGACSSTIGDYSRGVYQ